MAKASEQINELSTKVDGLSTVTSDIAADFGAFKAAMEAERENLTEDGQAALDAANAKLGDLQSRLGELDVAVGDADGSDVTQPVETGGTVPGGTETGDGVVPGDEAPPAGEGTVFAPDNLPGDVDGDFRPTV